MSPVRIRLAPSPDRPDPSAGDPVDLAQLFLITGIPA
jgi:hypothetical protein